MKHKPYETTFTKQIAELKPTNAIEYKLMLDIALMLLDRINRDLDSVLGSANSDLKTH